MYTYIFIFIFIAHWIISAGSHWIKLITWYKSKCVHERFLSQNIFRDSKKIFCDFPVGMELENEKPETRNQFCI